MDVNAYAPLTLYQFNIYSSLTGKLAHVPGPFLTKFTGLAHFISIFGGQRHLYLTALHEKYGVHTCCLNNRIYTDIIKVRWSVSAHERSP
jgi:hypothetical protein